MVNKINNSKDEGVEWTFLFEILSLSRVEPFLSEMGLDLPNPEAVRQCAREYVKEWSSGSGDNLWYLTLVRRTLQCIADTTDSETADYVSRWTMEWFHVGDQFQYSASFWQRILCRLAGIPGRKTTPPALPDDKLTLIEASIRQYFGDEFSALRERIKASDLGLMSEWDEYLYRLYREGISDDTSPFDIVEAVIVGFRFGKVWSAIEALLSSQEMLVLLEWGRTQARQMGITSKVVLPD